MATNKGLQRSGRIRRFGNGCLTCARPLNPVVLFEKSCAHDLRLLQMELLDLYTGTFDGLCDVYRGRILEVDADTSGELPEQRRNRNWWSRHGLQMLQLLNELKNIDGPLKWARDDHGYLEILPQRHIHLREQVKIEASGVGFYKVQYCMPTARLPWEHCISSTPSATDAARLVIDALFECEQDLIPRGEAYPIEWIIRDIANKSNGDGSLEIPPWLR